jgi:glucosylceramidase
MDKNFINLFCLVINQRITLDKSWRLLFNYFRIYFISIVFIFIASYKVSAQTVDAWMTTGDQSSLREQESSTSFVSNPALYPSTITVDESTTYQTMDGFGWCFTEGSAEVISGLQAGQQESLLTELFDTINGIGSSVVRISIGASDLGSSDYSYDDLTSGTDVNMTKFSLKGPDSLYLFPLLKKILIINPNIKILATPWSAPRWMKSNNAWKGGSLQTQYYDAYAKYFVKYITAMQAQGIPIWAITPQNEPENPGNEPSLVMNSTEETDFINNSLGPAFFDAGIKTKIIAYDHNCDDTNYPIYVCDNSTYVDGSAFHLYAGSITALTTVYNSTSKNVYFTEQYTGASGSFSGDFSWHLQNVMLGAPNNWAKTAIEWNLATDPSYGPHTPGGCSSCLGAITITSNTTYTHNVSFYIVAQLSQFVKSGAVRISSQSTDGNLITTSFINQDGTVVLAVMNTRGNPTDFKVDNGSLSFTYSIPAVSAITFIWRDPTGTTLTGSQENSSFPNPVKSNLTLDVTNDEPLNMIITDLSGKILLEQPVVTLNNKAEIDMGNFNNGIYIIRLKGNSMSYIYKIIKN